MNTYRVILHTKTVNRLKQGVTLDLNFPEGKVQVTELVEKMQAGNVPVGLAFRVDVAAQTLDEAILMAGSLADFVPSFITLINGVGVPVVTPVLCYETSGGKSERDFLQFFDDLPVKNPGRKGIPHEQLLDTIDLFLKVTDVNISERVARAIRWYRFGTGVTDPFDRFNSYWIGLEALNELLQERLSVKDDPIKCPSCEHEFVLFPTVSGIREFVKQFFPEEPKLYTRMHKIRINIVHSKTPLGPMVSEVTEVAPLAGNVLAGAIYYLLGINPPWKFPKVRSGAVPMRLAVEAKIISAGIEDALLPDGGDPHFEAVHSVSKIDSISENKVSLKGSSTLKAFIGKKASFTAYAFRLYGEGEGTLTINGVRNN